MEHTATFSPEDDKIRISPAFRLPPDEYAKVKAAGYRWAPMQKVFYAIWTPKAEDIALEMCGEIEDEDKSLVERAEERAERFEGYSDNRKHDADQAHAAVARIADNIPLGQPIICGHHSEKHARRDAAKIENGMRKTVAMWDQAQYWKDRAAGALRNAAHKERPDVRARRIKTIEAELRQIISRYTPCVTKERPNPQYIKQQRWNAGRDAEPVLHVWVGPPGRGGNWVPVATLEATKASYRRYEDHLINRIAYETAMLGEQIGVESFAERFDYQIGGKITVSRESAILTILKLNKKDGQFVSVSTNSRRWTRVVPVEDIKTYEPPAEGAAEEIKAATKRPPLCNYPGEGFAACTKAGWAKINKDYKSQSHVIPATDTHGAHCVRWAIGVYLTLPTPKPENEKDSTARSNYRHSYYPVYVTDEKRKDPPVLSATPTPQVPQIEHDDAAILADLDRRIEYGKQRESEKIEAAPFEAIREGLKTGVQVVVAPQLFPTPPEIARQMVDLAELRDGECVLEPSAGTGNLVQAILDAVDTEVLGCEINYNLCAQLEKRFPSYKLKVERGDFLERTDFQHCYPFVLMNPPFENAADIKHIKHAITFLKPGGRLVAICANGPRQQEQLKPIADHWEVLPAGSFKDSGTMVNAAIMVYNAPQLGRLF